MIDVSWTASIDVDDSVAYGFLLFNGPYSVETPALYTAEVGMTTDDTSFFCNCSS